MSFSLYGISPLESMHKLSLWNSWLLRTLCPFHTDLEKNYWLGRVNMLCRVGSFPLFSFKKGYNKQWVYLLMIFQVVKPWFVILILPFPLKKEVFGFAKILILFLTNFPTFKMIFKWGFSNMILLWQCLSNERWNLFSEISEISNYVMGSPFSFMISAGSVSSVHGFSPLGDVRFRVLMHTCLILN